MTVNTDHAALRGAVVAALDASRAGQLLAGEALDCAIDVATWPDELNETMAAGVAEHVRCEAVADQPHICDACIAYRHVLRRRLGLPDGR